MREGPRTPGTRPIEDRLDAPKTEMFEKYGTVMRNAADQLAKVVGEMRKVEYAHRLKVMEGGNKTEAGKLWQQREALNSERNRLRNIATWTGGGTVIKGFPERQKAGQSYDQFWTEQKRLLEAYNGSAMSDPHTVMRLMEAGEISSDNLKSIAVGLRSNPEFVRRMIEVAPPYAIQFLWDAVAGEARKDHDLYLLAVGANHLNYQFGSNEQKRDPAVREVALRSGLWPMYLAR